MMFLGRQSSIFLSLCRSSAALLVIPSTSRLSINQRRGFLVTTTSLVTAASYSYPNIATGLRSRCEASRTACSMSSLSTGYLNAADAAALDEDLMATPGFSLEQLMELAGLSVAEAVYQVIPTTSDQAKKPKILLICGPGNNGGDGLVAARHLVFFGYDCVVVYPKRSSKKQHFVNLVQQCHDVDIPVWDEMPSDLTEYDGVVDAIFGFSFKGEPREPFATALQQMIGAQKAGVPVISVDVPSGWNVDEGDIAGTGFVPEALVSLTTPKESSRGFSGRHFIGGRFLPPKLATKYNVQMPLYTGVSQVMEATPTLAGESTIMDQSSGVENNGWEAEYAAFLEQKYSTIETTSPNGTLATPQNEQSHDCAESWTHQYAEYCTGKEKELAQKDAEFIQELKNKHLSVG